MRFIETPIFTASLRKHVDDEAYRALQLALVLRPEQGALIRGGEGLRKLRWGAEGREASRCPHDLLLGGRG
jgi:hypothetical protein